MWPGAVDEPDAVDEIIEQWARQRPEADVSPMAVIGRLSRASRLVERGMKAYFATEGIEPWEFDVLATLRRVGPPFTLSPKDLVATAMVGSPALTYRVDRLVGRKLVAREGDPVSRRRLLISLTPEGLALVDRVLDGHVANEHRMLASLNASERDELSMLLRKLLVSLNDTVLPDHPQGD